MKELDRILKQLPKPTYKVKPKRWWWPPDRKKAKLMEYIVNFYSPEIAEKCERALRDHWLYGKPLPKYDLTERKEQKNG